MPLMPHGSVPHLMSSTRQWSGSVEAPAPEMVQVPKICGRGCSGGARSGWGRAGAGEGAGGEERRLVAAGWGGCGRMGTATMRRGKKRRDGGGAHVAECGRHGRCWGRGGSLWPALAPSSTLHHRAEAAHSTAAGAAAAAAAPLLAKLLLLPLQPPHRQLIVLIRVVNACKQGREHLQGLPCVEGGIRGDAACLPSPVVYPSMVVLPVPKVTPAQASATARHARAARTCHSSRWRCRAMGFACCPPRGL